MADERLRPYEADGLCEFSDDDAIRMIGCQLAAFGDRRHPRTGKTWLETFPKVQERLDAMEITPEEAAQRYREWKTGVDEHFAAKAHALKHAVVLGEVPDAEGNLVKYVSRGPTYPELRDGKRTSEDVIRHERAKIEAEKLAREREQSAPAAGDVIGETLPAPEQADAAPAGDGETSGKVQRLAEVGNKTAEPKSTPSEAKAEWEARALLLQREHPDWSDTYIADKVGRSPSALSRSATYQAGKAMMAGDKRNRPRGYVKVDPNTGLQDTEAYSDDRDSERGWNE